jgi:hypothetical protein
MLPLYNILIPNSYQKVFIPTLSYSHLIYCPPLPHIRPFPIPFSLNLFSLQHFVYLVSPL